MLRFAFFVLLITVVSVSVSHAIDLGFNINIPDDYYLDGSTCNNPSSSDTDQGSIYSHFTYNTIITTRYSVTNCTIKLDMGLGNRAMVYFKNTVYLLNICDTDRLTVYDGPDAGHSTLFTVCGTTTYSAADVWETTGRYLTVRLETSDSTLGDKGFRMFYTVFADAVGGSCGSSEFLCDTDRCIPDSHTCDGNGDCADDMDESEDSGCNFMAGIISKVLDLGVTVIAIIAVAVVLLCIMICVCCYCCCKKSKNRRPQQPVQMVHMQQPPTYA